jgi:4-hydroxybenzoate polyprenyltransferase
LNGCAAPIGQVTTNYDKFKTARRLSRLLHFHTAFLLALLMISLGFLALVVWWLREERETLLPVLTAVVGLIAGTGGGCVFEDAR